MEPNRAMKVVPCMTLDAPDPVNGTNDTVCCPGTTQNYMAFSGN